MIARPLGSVPTVALSSLTTRAKLLIIYIKINFKKYFLTLILLKIASMKIKRKRPRIIKPKPVKYEEGKETLKSVDEKITYSGKTFNDA